MGVGGWEGDCVTCFAPLFTTAEHPTCTILAEGSYIDDVTACMTGPCADPDCSAKLKALEACDVEGEEDCPGLCEVEEESPTSVWEKLFSSAKPKQYLRLEKCRGTRLERRSGMPRASRQATGTR